MRKSWVSVVRETSFGHACPVDVGQRRKSAKLRMVVVDDSEMMRGLIFEIVAALPWIEMVGEARDGKEGLEMIRRLKPELVTLDITMPKMNGIDVLRVLREEGLEARVFVLTALNSAEVKRRCFELGAEHVFDKGTELELFSEALGKLRK